MSVGQGGSSPIVCFGLSLTSEQYCDIHFQADSRRYSVIG